jgi:hypothetical protein
MAETRTVKTADLELIHSNITKTMAETMKLGAETAKINAELRYYPMVAFGAIAVGACGAIAEVLVKVL